MSWIRTISEAEADGELQILYAKLTGPEGEVDNILKVHSLNPKSLKGHLNFYTTLMRGRSPLSRIQREMIAVTVSTANRCHY